MGHLFTLSSCFCFAGVQVDIVSLMDLRFLTSLEKDEDESGEDVTPDGDSQSDEHPCIGNIYLVAVLNIFIIFAFFPC